MADQPTAASEKLERPTIVTTELGERLFRARLEEMRKVKPDIAEPIFIRRE